MRKKKTRPYPQPPLRRALAGEVLGTYLLVLFGTGSVASAVLSGAQVGLWQVAAVWGFGVTPERSFTGRAGHCRIWKASN